MPYVVAARWTVKDGESEAVAQAIADLVGPSRAEPGNLIYQPHRSFEDPSVFFFYEQYRDEAAFQEHVRSSHFQRYALENAIPRLISRERAFYDTAEF